MTTPDLTGATWRKSTFSGDNGQCVEVAQADGLIAVRNSNFPDAETVWFTPAEMGAFVKGCAAGEFDDLAT